MDEKGSLTVHVEDAEGTPVSGKNVRCNFPGIFPTYADRRTDEDGIAYFDDVPVCVAECHANGARVEVGISAGAHEDVTLTL